MFGAAVRQLREAPGWTQEQLAERSEMNASYLGFLERGDNVPTLSIIIQLAEAFGMEPADLLREMTRRS
ncbi:MAG TPA: helix-turn-helix transcriptional regulator [Thermoanaerobaculia bacterium]